MEDSKFYKKIWRFNALVIATIGILGICFVLVFIVALALDALSKTEYNTIKTPTHQTLKEELELGGLEEISGSHSVMTMLHSNQYYENEYASKAKVESTRNILFSDMNTGQSHWLFADNHQLILRSNTVKSNELTKTMQDTDNKTIAILYKVVKADSNQDGEINDDDDITVALTTPEGKNYTELTAINGFRDYKYLKEKNQLSLMAYKNGKRHIVFVDLTNFSIVKNVPLPEIIK